MLLLLLSHFSHVRLCATPETGPWKWVCLPYVFLFDKLFLFPGVVSLADHSIQIVHMVQHCAWMPPLPLLSLASWLSDWPHHSFSHELILLNIIVNWWTGPGPSFYETSNSNVFSPHHHHPPSQHLARRWTGCRCSVNFYWIEIPWNEFFFLVQQWRSNFCMLNLFFKKCSVVFLPSG